VENNLYVKPEKCKWNLNKIERNYKIYNKEILAVIRGLEN